MSLDRVAAVRAAMATTTPDKTPEKPIFIFIFYIFIFIFSHLASLISSYVQYDDGAHNAERSGNASELRAVWQATQGMRIKLLLFTELCMASNACHQSGYKNGTGTFSC